MELFFSVRYWFNPRPGSLVGWAQTGLIIFVALLAISAFIFTILKTRKSIYFRVWQRLYNFCITNFILGLLLIFFATQLIPVLSARILYLAWAISMTVWMVFILRFIFTVPGKIKKKKEEKEFQKYVP